MTVPVWVATTAVAALLLAACSSQPSQAELLGQFDTLMDQGASCADLYDVRNRLDAKSPEVPEVNKRLRAAGCTSAGSERQPVTAPEHDASESAAATLTAACEDAFREAAAADMAASDAAIVETLSACTGVDEWFAGLRAYPESFGLNERASIGPLQLELACYEAPDMQVCSDARARGLLSD